MNTYKQCYFRHVECTIRGELTAYGCKWFQHLTPRTRLTVRDRVFEGTLREIGDGVFEFVGHERRTP